MRRIPASCADLDPEAVGDELIRTAGNVGRAAAAFGVKTPDLRLFVCARPELLDAALEADALAIDAAQAFLIEATRSGPPSDRIRAAGLLLRSAAAGRRGF